jgi:uncharacterized protein
MKPKAARIWKNVAVVSAGVVALLIMFRAFEYSQVYHPSRESEYAVTDLHPQGDDFFLTSSDGVKLHAWFLPGESDSPRRDFVFLFCHGNGGNLTSRPSYYRAILATGAGLMPFDYRGYGKSGGEVGEEGTYLDAFAAYDWLIARGTKPGQIIVWGESLGGGIASKVAHDRPVGGLVLQSTFTSIPDIGADLFPLLPVRTLATIQYDTNRRLPDIKCPVVVMHSQTDEIIPYTHGRKNFEAANEPKVFIELEGGHNDAIYADQTKYIAGAEAVLEVIENPVK